MFFRRRNQRSCLSPRMRALMAAYLSALTEPGVLTAPPSDPYEGATGTSGSAPGSVNA